MMGSYGIGPARIAAAAIEQGADERGIVWPPSIAPWSVHLVSLAKAGEEERAAADRIYEELRELLPGEVLYDDRDAGPGEKLTDAELLGCPLRARGRPPRPRRRGSSRPRPGAGEDADVSIEGAAAEIVERLASLSTGADATG